MKLKPCPSCDSEETIDCYVYIQCAKCLMTGPQMNKGRNDDHADYIDHQNAENAWNSLPRKNDV